MTTDKGRARAVRHLQEGVARPRFPVRTSPALLLSQNVHPKFVQELLGHTSIAQTLDTYSHAVGNLGDATVRAMENTLS